MSKELSYNDLKSGATRGTGKNGVRRNSVVHKRGLSDPLPCGHAKRLLVAGKCLGCEKSGPMLEVL
jgi:hypothetical protein